MAAPWEKYSTEKKPWENYQPAGGISTVTTRPVDESTEFMDELAGQWKERGQRVGDIIERRHGDKEGFTENLLAAQRTGLQVGGQVVGGMLDPAEMAIGKAVSPLFKPLKGLGDVKIGDITGGESQDQEVQKLLNTTLGQAGLKAIQKGGDVWRKFEERFPDAGADIRAVLNISELSGGAFVGKKAVREGLDIASDASTLTRKLTAPKTDTGLEKAIARRQQIDLPDEKMQNLLKPNKTQIAKHGGGNPKTFYKKTKEGAFDWYDNKENFTFNKGDYSDEIIGQIPKNFVEGAQAVTQTKKTIYQEMKRLRGGADIQISQKPLATKLLSKVDDFPADSDTARLLSKRADDLITGRNMTVDEVGNHIEALNAAVRSHVANNAPAKSGRALLDDIELAHWREVRNDSILKATGEDIAPLQAAYGRQLALEEGIKKGLMDSMKLQKNSIVDTFSSFADAHLLAGLATGGKAQLILGGTAKVETLIKRIVSHPDYKFKKVMKGVESAKKFQEALEGPFKPKSYVGKKLAPKPKSIYAADQVKQIKQKYPNAKLNKKGEYVTMLGGKEFKVQP